MISKNLVPIVWDLEPSELPGWANEIQMLDLRRSTMQELQNHIADFASRIKQEKLDGLRTLNTVVLALWQLERINRGN